VLFILASVVWLASSNYWRERLYFPTVLVVLLALGLVSAAAWHSGETVYVHGTAVERMMTLPSPSRGSDTQVSDQMPTTAPQTTAQHYGDRRDEYSVGRPEQGVVEPYIPPLQLHLLLAGLTVAVSLGALGVSVRRWSQEVVIPIRTEVMSPPGTEPIEPSHASVYTRATVALPPATSFPIRLPARLWLVAVLFGVGTVLAGLWYTDDWKLTALAMCCLDRASFYWLCCWPCRPGSYRGADFLRGCWQRC
jgi:hypothetical protein